MQPASFPRLKRIARRIVAGLLSSLVLAASGSARAAAEDLTELSLETLMDTEVLSAARFARGITDSAAAVSVLTSEDIRLLGLRTLGEALDQMRGLHITADGNYVYLGARGLGGPGSFAGRVLLLIDGIPALDNVYDQLFLGHDALIDAAMIDRIEYAPGSGSAIYGNNAFLGVVNVVTLRGRDLGGTQAALAGTSHDGRQARLSWGDRFANGFEALVSLTLHRNDAATTLDQADIDRESPDRRAAAAYQFFAKTQWLDFSLQAMGSARTVRNQSDDSRDRFIDASRYISFGHDRNWNAQWSTSSRLTIGNYRFQSTYSSAGSHDRFQQDGRWAGLETQAGYQGFEGHRLVFGLRARRDPTIRSSSRYHYQFDEPVEPAPGEPPVSFIDGSRSEGTQRKNAGVSVEDEIRLRDDLRATLGLRYDRRTGLPWTPSPRAALVWSPTPAWQLKWSQGRSTRYASSSEEGIDPSETSRRERVGSRELVGEYRQDALRVLATVYRYRVTGLVAFLEDVTSIEAQGAEMEAEWQWRGWRLRASQTWQNSVDNLGRAPSYSPRRLSKLQVSVPLGSERVRLSGALRHTSAYTTSEGEPPLPSLTRLDLTLVAMKLLGPLQLSIGVRNVTGSTDHGFDTYFTEPSLNDSRRRRGWLELSGTFQ